MENPHSGPCSPFSPCVSCREGAAKAFDRLQSAFESAAIAGFIALQADGEKISADRAKKFWAAYGATKRAGLERLAAEAIPELEAASAEDSPLLTEAAPEPVPETPGAGASPARGAPAEPAAVKVAVKKQVRAAAKKLGKAARTAAKRASKLVEKKLAAKSPPKKTAEKKLHAKRAAAKLSATPKTLNGVAEPRKRVGESGTEVEA